MCLAEKSFLRFCLLVCLCLAINVVLVYSIAMQSLLYCLEQSRVQFLGHTIDGRFSGRSVSSGGGELGDRWGEELGDLPLAELLRQLPRGPGRPGGCGGARWQPARSGLAPNYGGLHCGALAAVS